MNKQDEFVSFAMLRGSSAAASVIGGADGMSLAYFTKLFKSIVDEVTVPEGIPAAED